MTEQEAKSKICPFSKEGYNRNFCEASKCMMWRVKRVVVEQAQPYSTLKDVGYCGLAGVTDI